MFKDTVPHKRIYLQTYVVGYLTPSLGSINPCLKCWVNTTFTDAVYRWQLCYRGTRAGCVLLHCHSLLPEYKRIKWTYHLMLFSICLELDGCTIE